MENKSGPKATHDLEHQVLAKLNESGLGGKKILVALSGGADSVALLQLLSRVHRQGEGAMAACYFHHGPGENASYRDQAQSFCQELCEENKITFFKIQSQKAAHSEAEYRELRHEALTQLMKEKNFDCLAFGHHRDDLLETRLLRLIRGTGGQGLPAMHVWSHHHFRPLLGNSKSELIQYLEATAQKSKTPLFVDDPSNQSLDPLRNWVRSEWLPMLEKRQSGAMGALARSLELISQDLQQQKVQSLLAENESFKSQQSEIKPDHSLSRSFYLSLSSQDQGRLLAQYLLSLGKKDFSQSQIEEIKKRLDNPQRVITFKVAGCIWDINAEQIKVQS